MKKILVLFAVVLVISCSKEPLDTIDPVKSPSAFSSSLLIDGINISGQPNFDELANNLSVTDFQTSATIATDNFLFIPFAYTANESFDKFYFYVEGADNYWEIPKKDSLGGTEYVLDIGIPDNIDKGNLIINYGLVSSSGKVSAPAKLSAEIILPEVYCNSSSTPSLVEGNDGITVRTYNLGTQAGWVTFEYNTLIEPDRIDIRYNREWIRSTGEILGVNQQFPPTGDCTKVTPKEGFVGTQGFKQFTFYYDPIKSDKLDIYVSGCLNGTTIWRYRLQCPEQRPVLGLHSSADPSNPDPCAGHSWVTFWDLQNQNVQTYALWPDYHDAIIADGLNNGSGSDVRIDFRGDAYYDKYNRFYPLTSAQIVALNNFVIQHQTYSIPDYVCTSFAQELVEVVTGEKVEAADFYQGSPIETPRAMSASIEQLELFAPSGSFFNVLGLPKGNTNIVACFK